MYITVGRNKWASQCFDYNFSTLWSACFSSRCNILFSSRSSAITDWYSWFFLEFLKKGEPMQVSKIDSAFKYLILVDKAFQVLSNAYILFSFNYSDQWKYLNKTTLRLRKLDRFDELSILRLTCLLNCL